MKWARSGTKDKRFIGKLVFALTEFDYEVKQRKALVPSARRKVNGSRSKGCTLPSDNLTEGARKKLNGEIVTINMNKPYTYAELRKTSEDIQRQYIKRLQDEYNASVRMLCPMLGASYQTVRELLIELCINRPKSKNRPTKKQKFDFEAFCKRDDLNKIEESMQKAPAVTVDSKPPKSKQDTPVFEIKDDEYSMEQLCVTLEGQTFAVCKKLIEILGTGTFGRFTIRFNKINQLEEGGARCEKA